MKNLLLIISLFISVVVSGQGFEQKKNVRKSFVHVPGKQIEITNRYGMIRIEEWAKDSVAFEVSVAVTSDNKIDVTEIMNSIDFKFVNTTSFTIAQAVFLDEASSFFKDLKKAVLGSNNGIKIDWIVYLPKENYELSVENKYGDVYGGNFNEKTKFSVSYGKLKVHDFNAKTDIELNFADANINDLTTASIVSNYSDIEIHKLSSLNLNSKSSNINIEELSEITFVSKRDNIRVNKINIFDADMWSSNIKIGNLNNKFIAKAKYGTVNIENVSPSFSKIIMNSKYTDLSIVVDDIATNSNIDITHRNCKVYLPKTNIDVKEELISKEEMRFSVKGKIGSKPDPVSSISIFCEYGIINLIQK